MSYVYSMQELNNKPINVPDTGEIRHIEKQIKGKNKELKSLGKEMKSKRKKRSGAVISDDMTRLNNDVDVLNEQIAPVTTWPA